MDTRISKGTALGITAILALAVSLALLSTTGVTRTAWADNLDVCSSGCPYAMIQDAVYAAQDGDTVRVAAGTYTGTMSCTYWGGGTFTNTLCITEDITLMGGYNPVDFNMRDPDQFTTTIKWEGDPGHIVMNLVNGTSATVDGFEITGATGAPIGAIYIKDSAPTISHNRIVGNHTAGHGGGIYVSTNSTPTIKSNFILSNTADQSGGGIAVRWGATAVISGNLIAYNEAISNGGGIFVVEGSNVILTNNEFLSNTASGECGGGLLAEGGSILAMSGNTFEGNVAGDCGGGMAARWDTNGTIVENTFRGNTALGWHGGGVYLDSSSFDVLSNTITKNHTEERGGGIGLAGDNTHVTMVGNVVESNTAQKSGGGVSVEWGPEVIIQSNDILSNVVQEWQGSGVSIVMADVQLDSNLIAYNGSGASDGFGAVGVYMDTPPSPVTITNNLIVENVDKGIGVYGNTSDLRIVNNTIARNQHEGFMVWESLLVEQLRNNIIASNEWCGVAVATGSQVQTLDYNDVWNNGYEGEENYCDYGGSSVPGLGSISADPQFIDAAAGDYHIAWGSPAMNAGTNAGAPEYDKDGVARPQMGIVDMGAYEARAPYRVFLPITLKAY